MCLLGKLQFINRCISTAKTQRQREMTEVMVQVKRREPNQQGQQIGGVGRVFQQKQWDPLKPKEMF